MSDSLAIAIENSLSIITFSLDRAYRYIAFSKIHFQTMKAIWGVEISINTSILDLIQENDRVKAKINFDRALAGETFTLIEDYGDVKLQRYFWEDKYSPIFLNDEIVGLSVSANEITKFVEVSKKLEETQNRLTIALESSQIGVWEWDIIQDKIYWSENMYDIFELDRNTDLKFDTYLPLIHPEDKEFALQIIQDGISNKEDYIISHRIILKDNTIRWLFGNAKVIYEQNGEANRYIGTCLDITNQKNAELELLNKNLELTKINAELDKFVYSASHDLRAPVASMLGLVDLARREKNQENLHLFFDLQEKSLKKMDDFIYDIISFSKNKRLELELSKIDFEFIINESFEQLHFINNATKIEKIIIVKGESDFFSDVKRIQTVINNIISNAIKYFDAGKSHPYIKINIEINPKNAIIIISDNGIGIQKNDLDKIFNMFYRGTAIGNGSGLGLYIVKDVVDKLNGTIEHSSTYGVGTEVKITLFNFLNKS